MTITIVLNADQINTLRAHNEEQVPLMINAAQANAITNDQFVFFAAFDGTNNDMNYHPSDPYDTNVAQLWNQYLAGASGKANCKGGYYPGVGTAGTVAQSAWNPAQVTKQTILTAERAYNDFCVQASAWLQAPGNGGKTVGVALTSFSRGGVSAALFSQLLHARGLVDPRSGKLLIPPREIRVVAGVLFDTVTTGVAKNLTFLRNVGNILDIVAWNEYRYLFKGADYGNQANTVKMMWMYGNHCDVGGSYDRGLSALTLQAATGYLKRSGLPIANVQTARQYVPGEVAVHSEQFDNTGKNQIWDVYVPEGFSFVRKRDLEPIGTPPKPGSTFVLYDGTTVVN